MYNHSLEIHAEDDFLSFLSFFSFAQIECVSPVAFFP